MSAADPSAILASFSPVEGSVMSKIKNLLYVYVSFIEPAIAGGKLLE